MQRDPCNGKLACFDREMMTQWKIQKSSENNISLMVIGSWLEVYKSKVANPWLGLGEFGPHCICMGGSPWQVAGNQFFFTEKSKDHDF